VYRDDANYIIMGPSRFTGASSTTGTTFAWPAMAATGDTPGILTPNQWVIAAAMTNQSASTIDSAPSGYTNRAVQAGASATKIVLHDTNAAVASVSGVNQTYTTGSSNLGAIGSIQDTGIAKSSGGGFRAVNIRGGADQ
jgi:hypothetical protein